jgi:hypothetical protein
VDRQRERVGVGHERRLKDVALGHGEVVFPTR